VALVTLMIIAAVFGLIYLQHRNGGNSQIDVGYMHFEVRTLEVRTRNEDKRETGFRFLKTQSRYRLAPNIPISLITFPKETLLLLERSFQFRFQDSTDSLKKPLKGNYTDENAGNTVLPHDKFQLCPQRLKLKGILGSGAYGIVRLASLQDEFGTVTDVAVKTMKGITRLTYDTRRYVIRTMHVR